MRAAIIGAGAMGGTLAAEAAAAGHEVTVVDVAAPLLQQVREHGITVDTPQGRIVSDIRAVTDVNDAGDIDIAIVFVKAAHTPTVAAALSSAIGPDTAVLTLQNGWGNADVLAEQVPGDQLVVGVTYNSCTVRGVGHTVHTGRGPTFVGSYRTDTATTHAERVAAFLNTVDWQSEHTSTVRTEIWKKLILNAATLPTAGLTGLTAGELGQPGPMLDLVDAIIAEAVAVADAQQLGIDLDERIQTVHTVLEGAGKGKASMLQDVEARRTTEIETINAAVVRAGDAHGVPVELNRTMVALIKGLERGWQQ